ncbi:MAG: hypothetical protein M3P37_07655 [Actinomycetota bacterium]|nr:hypothetical protein [Actinomycetota bacterium]
MAYIQAPNDSPAPEPFVEAIKRHRNAFVGEFSVDRVELTLLDLSKEYPKPETFAALPLGSQP